MKHQTGSALIVSLLILLVMSMLGISAMSTSTMQEKMSANDKNHKTAFINAESALIQAERAILTKDGTQLHADFEEAKEGFYGADHDDYTKTAKWKIDNGNCISSIENACYTVEDIGIQTPLTASDYSQPAPTAIQVTRITVRSTDNGGTSNAMLQSYLGKTLQQ